MKARSRIAGTKKPTRTCKACLLKRATHQRTVIREGGEGDSFVLQKTLTRENTGEGTRGVAAHREGTRRAKICERQAHSLEKKESRGGTLKVRSRKVGKGKNISGGSDAVSDCLCMVGFDIKRGGGPRNASAPKRKTGTGSRSFSRPVLPGRKARGRKRGEDKRRNRKCAGRGKPGGGKGEIES